MDIVKRRPVKKPKLFYYAKNILRQALPGFLYRQLLGKKLNALNNYNAAEIADRVNYYNKLKQSVSLGESAIRLRNMAIFKSPKAYNFDTFEYTRYFDGNLKACFLFGDVIHTPAEPTIQKSRPIGDDNANAVLLKLDKYRHFVFVDDKIPFEKKQDVLIGRGVVTQPHRIRFMEMYFNSPLCNLGQVNTNGGNIAWLKPKIGIKQHLQYKFILSLEGNDVATNLKWIMSSNSIAVMPAPRYETWFMEGRLIPNVHYIHIKDDFSDLEERLQYYIDHPEEARQIAVNANNYVKQFFDKQKEDIISLLVLQKYFEYTLQLK
ncbi:glycosyltransferase family 90 protein [Mucilaginibacter sp. UR6-1]|uniref:glycosyltransferase family 90 protein n=1 Tax=Mucilaginibacter sp. UR6-1 TaxID=1435643 RepID=UPI001E587831|nr:glycosyltransferase family 90 protein [Mucilaginibacter sp. UR6-1]